MGRLSLPIPCVWCAPVTKQLTLRMTSPRPPGKLAHWKTTGPGLVVIALPILIWLIRPIIPALGTALDFDSGGAVFAKSRLLFSYETIGGEHHSQPAIRNVQLLDLDNDSQLDILACDARLHEVLLYQRTTAGSWEGSLIADRVVAPANATVVDLDTDGDPDLVVSALGDLYPSEWFPGRLTWIEQAAAGVVHHVLMDNVRRIADAQPGDFDGDGDIDLVVAVSGFTHGRILWLENQGDQSFVEHELYVGPGATQVLVSDYDGDGDPDFAAAVLRQEGQVFGFENTGGGKFKRHTLFSTLNHDLRTGGLVRADMDNDGDDDLLLPVGGNPEDPFSGPQPYHGCWLLENQLDWKFENRRIAEFAGTCAAATGDLDADGDRDVVLVSMTNDWHRTDTASIIWLEHDGAFNFTPWQIASSPTHLFTVACGDLNGDGRDDIVAGGMHLSGPFNRTGRISAWMSRTVDE